MKIILTLVIALSLLGCASETEQKGLDQIAQLYNAKTSYSKGFSSSVGEKTTRRFSVKVSESALIDSLQPTVTSGNIALLVYQNMAAEEKTKYDSIYVELVNLKNDTAAYSYPTTLLQDMNPKGATFNTFSEHLVDGNFDEIDAMRNQKEIPQEIGPGLKANVQGKEKMYGKLTGFEPFGIAEVSDELGSAYQFQGFLVFRNKKIPYFAIVDTAPGKDALMGFRIFK